MYKVTNTKPFHLPSWKKPLTLVYLSFFFFISYKQIILCLKDAQVNNDMQSTCSSPLVGHTWIPICELWGVYECVYGGECSTLQDSSISPLPILPVLTTRSSCDLAMSTICGVWLYNALPTWTMFC